MVRNDDRGREGAPGAKVGRREVTAASSQPRALAPTRALGTELGPRIASATASHVESIILAAEQTAERVRAEAEEQVRGRIAEGERAARNRIRAAEDEAEEIVGDARAEAAGLRQAARVEADSAVASATSEALAIVARAQESAERSRTEGEQARAKATGEGLSAAAKAEEAARRIIADANAAAADVRDDAERRARQLLRDARSAAGDVRAEGLEIVENLREMGDSLRSNAQRLLLDIQSVHSRMVAEIERADGDLPRAQAPARLRESAGGRRTREVEAPPDGEALDVPEFIPRR